MIEIKTLKGKEKMKQLEIKKGNFTKRAILLNSNTQKAQNFVYNYLYAKYDDVSKFYGKPSYYKVASQEKIMDSMYHLDGWGYRVCGGNSCTYTAGWLVNWKGGTFLIYETHCNTYAIKYNVNGGKLC